MLRQFDATKLLLRTNSWGTVEALKDSLTLLSSNRILRLYYFFFFLCFVEFLVFTNVHFLNQINVYCLGGRMGADGSGGGTDGGSEVFTI